MNMKLVSLYKKIRRAMMSPKAYAESIGVKMGVGCSIETKDFPHEGYLIEFGDYVRVAAHAAFYTHGGVVALRKLYDDPNLDQFGKVRVGNYSFIGAHAMIMGGVIVGERCIVAGGSVVTHSVPDGCMVAGNPARIIGHTEDYYKRVKEKYDLGCKGMSDRQKRDFLLSLPDSRFFQKSFMKDDIVKKPS